MKFIDLAGQRFGRLIVIERDEDYIQPNGRHRTMWKCKCDCNKIITVHGDSLKNGYTKSCGCLKSIAAITNGKKAKKYNDYEIQEDYVIMYTIKDEMFIVDLEDFEYVRKHCWHKHHSGYFETTINKKKIRLHQFIMQIHGYFNQIIDHVHGEQSKYDNRKYNLRPATKSENNMNHKIRKDNKSGCSGVCWSKQRNKWKAYIGYGNKDIILGYFDNKDDAIRERMKAEVKYHGEFSYNCSQTCV